MGIAFMTLSMVVYTVHVTCQDIDGGTTEADGGASAPVGPSVATPLPMGVALVTKRVISYCWRTVNAVNFIVKAH